MKDIVITEDDRDEIEIFEEALNEVGIPYVMRYTNDGTLLFDLLDARLPDILFLDIHLPKKDGMECVFDIRRNPAYDKMAIIIYSSMLMPAHIDDLYNKGANHFLEKQSNFKNIVAKLKTILEKETVELATKQPREKFFIQ